MSYEVSGGWFTKQIMSRVHTENNCLLIIVGETGTGKSCMGLSLCQHFDPYFSAKRIAFTAKEFLDLLPVVPHKGWILWDEVGVYLSHRRWQSEANIQIMQIIQSFRYKLINVIFTLPSATYMDIVARTMCHYLIVMTKRGQATVYRILKPTYEGSPWTKRLNPIWSEMPTTQLFEQFERMRTAHQDALYELSRKEAEVRLKTETESLEQKLKGKRGVDEDIKMAMVMLPEIVRADKDTDQGRIDIPKMKRIFEERLGIRLPHNRAHQEIRGALLERLHADDDKLLKRLLEEKRVIQ